MIHVAFSKPWPLETVLGPTLAGNRPKTDQNLNSDFSFLIYVLLSKVVSSHPFDIVVSFAGLANPSPLEGFWGAGDEDDGGLGSGPVPGRPEAISAETNIHQVPYVTRRTPGRNPNPLRGFSQDLLNLRGPPQNPPWAGFEGYLSN